MSRPRFLVVLTMVRPTVDGCSRDERNSPERIVEAVGATDRQAAQKIFAAMCALPSVRAGKQRAKILDLAGQDQWEPGQWVAPLVTEAARRALIRMGVRRAWTGNPGDQAE